MMSKTLATLQDGHAYTIFVCAGWATISTMLIMLNNYILNNDDFHYPIFLCSLGQLCSYIGATVFIRMGWATQNAHLTPMDYVKQILPIGLMSAGTLACGNAAYMYLSVSFIQMLKAGTPAITMFCLFVFGMEKPRRDLLVAVGLIVVSCAVSAYGEIAFAMVGFVLMLLSETFEALKLVMTQKLLHSTFSGPIEALYHTTPITFLCLVALIIPFEGRKILVEDGLDKIAASPLMYLLAGCLGFILNLFIMAVIKRTSSLSFKVLGQAKNVVVVIIGAVFLGNLVTPVQTVSYGVSIAGFFLYQRAMDNKKAENATSKDIESRSQEYTALPLVDEGEGSLRKASHTH
ncbi:hypothetical protein SARC_02953 [Sphaeroforma arctica JP610]|uniref:Sugar phosphate transporter domain-containing protein n=1 Tax=Sphaeroforma arctica JP610 TaxID=667725 RepID=A0A0L0G729_9EUKA|nr:hypothetical protein SARC_02953 [Sphaeroforma arctica JP610]KNC84842.1 hypothetical protein SARC_02953 [Sphaeroforma arctica JP610]|eukprot:XP_014158744.1 hypothetical protein SARC_02953 [Sphaeroforma arctica JP610]